MAGVNLSGAEFGKVPGRIGYDYDYPSAAEIDDYQKRGFKIVRIPFRWLRLQPTLFSALSQGDRASLRKAVDYATSRGLTVVLDMHDYAARPVAVGGQKVQVGSTDLPETALADAWGRIAADYQGNIKVWLGLMNEPSGIAVSDWWDVVQKLVRDLRDQHISNKLLIPGGRWTGAHSWLSSGNAARAEAFVDPNNNYAFELHQYLDSDSSGTHETCSAGANARVDAALNWASRTGAKLFFGEIAAGSAAPCADEYGRMLQKLNASRSVIGWTAWGAGARWNPNYMFRIDPINGTTTPHMTMLLANMPT